MAKATKPNSLGPNSLAKITAEIILEALSNQRKPVKYIVPLIALLPRVGIYDL